MKPFYDYDDNQKHSSTKYQMIILSFLASKAISDAVAEDAVADDAVRPTEAVVTVGAAVVKGCCCCCCVELNSCSFSCSLKLFGLGGDLLCERRLWSRLRRRRVRRSRLLRRRLRWSWRR